MVERDEGSILVQSFAEAIRNELKHTGVTITALMPGPTDTEFFERADARQGFDALMAGKQKVVGGSLKHKVQTAVSGVTPDSVKAEMHRKMAEPGSAD